MNEPLFIAEIKTQSPFGFKSPHSFVELMECAIQHGDWVSVHTNALWGGDYDAISFVRRNTNKPILAKGIHASDDDVMRAIDHGAEYVLVVDRKFEGNGMYHKHIIYERNNPVFAITEAGISELDCKINRVNEYGDKLKYLVNSRDLSTGLKKEKYTRELYLYLKAGVWVCQGSGIQTPEDVHPDADAFIVGEHLHSYCRQLL